MPNRLECSINIKTCTAPVGCCSENNPKISQSSEIEVEVFTCDNQSLSYVDTAIVNYWIEPFCRVLPNNPTPLPFTTVAGSGKYSAEVLDIGALQPGQYRLSVHVKTIDGEGATLEEIKLSRPIKI